jgi:hypothetical protein
MSAFAIPWHPSARTLRQFAGLWLICIGLMAWRLGHTGGAFLAVLAVSFGVAGLVRPVCVRPLFVALTVLTLPVGWVVSNVLLVVVFYGVLTPIGFLFRLQGRDVLDRRFRPDRESYWEPKAQPADLARYFRSF